MEERPNVAGISENLSNTIEASVSTKKNSVEEANLFKNLKIGISISDSPDLMKLGYSPMHLQDASVEFARYLLVHGATLIYGGDLRQDGFTFLFSELAKLYTGREKRGEERFVNYFAWPMHLKLDKFAEFDFKERNVGVIRVPPPASVKIDTTKFLSPDTNEAKAIWAKSLTYLREQLNENTIARIFLGGKTANFAGRYPGIAEEAFYALKDNKPVYLIGAYGGITKEITNLLVKKSSEIMTEAFQCMDKNYSDFFNYWNNFENEKIDYAKLSLFFSDYGLSKISQCNGLNEEENLQLFRTNNLLEMIFLVLKGLTSVMKNKT